jgi:flavin reductase (DIM6/NTAB) family NADH-FMN oxidoreductase RutF
VDFDFTALPAPDRYRLLCDFVGPRPIALVTTVAPGGARNAAPMSFFNVLSHDPPIVALGVQARRDGTPKDTARNIFETGEFVVNMVDIGLADQMVQCGLEYPSDVDEALASGLTWVASELVAPGRIRESPCSMECRLERSIDYERRSIILGEVVHMSVRDECLDAGGRSVAEGTYLPIARLHDDNYIEARDQFVLRAPIELLNGARRRRPG